MKKITSLVRSLRTMLAASEDSATSAPVVVLPWSYSAHLPKPPNQWPPDYVDAQRALHKLDALPLPFERCVIVADIDNPFSPTGIFRWYAWVIAPMDLAGEDGIAAVELLWEQTSWIYTKRVHWFTRKPLPDHPVNDGDSPIYSQLLRIGDGLTHCWATLVHDVDDPGGAQFFLLSPRIEPLARLMSPCGYMLRSMIHEPYGPPILRDQLWRDPFYTLINWERMYRESAGACGTHAPPRPHDRRGFVRHHWAQAKIDRRTLPKRAEDRLRIAEARNVPRSYVHPCKVRPAVFWFDDAAAHEEIDWGYDNAFRIVDAPQKEANR